MSKESQKIISAYHLGEKNKRLNLPYKNPFNKNKDKVKYKAYKNGYDQLLFTFEEC
jgi:hypothetical protein